MTGEFVTDGHLGGYIAGGDPATYYPDLWRWLALCGVRTVVDVGCGEGHAVAFFRELGVLAYGVDGMPVDRPHVVQHDFTVGPFPATPGCDLVWSCEFVEHVDEQYVDNFLPLFATGTLVLMTHAAPGQPGWHHVNCQPPEYWVDRMDGIGYDLDELLTAETRALAACNTNPHNHYARSGIAFRRREEA